VRIESRHRVHATLRRADGRIEAAFGDRAAASFWRSALKPFQALPILEDGVAAAFGYGPEELAVTCASHGGRPEHLARVERILAAIGKSPEDLHCGPHLPYDEAAALELHCARLDPGRLHNNCSGKHASMLALALERGWDPEGYWRFEHPVQARVRELLPSYIDLAPESLPWETDGCGIPTLFLPLEAMALAYARLAAGGAAPGTAAAGVVAAMTGHPELTSSPGREPLRIMEATAGRLLAKEGAEGVLCVAAVGEDWGLALKVEDGSRRAVGPAAVALLASCDLLEPGEADALVDLAEPPIEDTLGRRVGAIRAVAGRPAAAVDRRA
jgi:L-asparaginase II